VEGGGRLIGEAGHFFDLMNYFASSSPVEVQAFSFPFDKDKKEGLFNFMVQVKYENNSMGQLTYTSLGGPKLPRETVELFCGSKYLQIIDFRELKINKKTKIKKSDLGHVNELKYFYQCLKGKKEIDKLEMLFASWICLKVDETKNR
jgi:predicted dehydrogenase